MNQTANLGLNLPEESDWAEVATLNENWEKVDEAVAKKAELGADGKIPAEQLPAMNYDPAGSAAAVQTNLTNHINNKNNPHGVTPGQIGAIPSSGGSVSGPLNFANSAWNNVGDDAAFGDRNVAGNFCVKGLNGAPGITLFTSDESQSYQVFGQHNLSLLMSQLSANSVCRIATGTYTGTGNYQVITIVFPFSPTFFAIPTFYWSNTSGSYIASPAVGNGDSFPIIVLSSLQQNVIRYVSALGYQATATYDQNTRTLTIHTGDSYNPNGAGSVYYWIAI